MALQETWPNLETRGWLPGAERAHGKVGRELQADRKNAERATPWQRAGWARGRPFTSFDRSRAEGTGQEGRAAAGGGIERAPPGGPECRASSPTVSPGRQGGPERIKVRQRKLRRREERYQMRLRRKLGRESQRDKRGQSNREVIPFCLVLHLGLYFIGEDTEAQKSVKPAQGHRVRV